MNNGKINKIFVFLFFCLPTASYGESVIRLDHTLPEFKILMPDTFFQSDNVQEIAKNLVIKSAYIDGASATLEQLARMADGSVQQIDIGKTVAPLDGNGMMPIPVSGDISFANYFMPSIPLFQTTKLALCSPSLWVSDAGGKGWKIGDTAVTSNDYSKIKVTKINNKGGIADFDVIHYANNPKDFTGQSAWATNDRDSNSHACFSVVETHSDTLLFPSMKSISHPGRYVEAGEVLELDKAKTEDLYNFLFSKSTPYLKISNGRWPGGDGKPIPLRPYGGGKYNEKWSSVVDLRGINTDTAPWYSSPEYGVRFPYAGDSFPTISIPNRNLPTVTIGRVDFGGVNNTSPSYLFDYVNDDGSNGYNSQYFINKRNVEVHTVITKNGIGSTHGLGNIFDDAGMGGYGQQNYAFQNVVHKYGLSWTWAIADELDEMGGLDISYTDRSLDKGPSTVEIEGEHNLNSVGPDMFATYYSSKNVQHRTNQLASHGLFDAYIPFWTPDTVYVAHQMIRVVDLVDGAQYLYVTDKGGKSGFVKPSSFSQSASLVNDNTVTWVFIGPLVSQTGVAYMATAGCAIPSYPKGYHGPVRPACAEIGVGFAADANVYNTVFDASSATYLQPGAKVWARTKADTFIDMSADSTIEELDKHLFGYSSHDKEWQFKVKTSGMGSNESFSSAFHVQDNGNIGLEGMLILKQFSKDELVKKSSLPEGAFAYDKTDHVPVLYACPENRCAWYPIQYGTPLK